MTCPQRWPVVALCSTGSSRCRARTGWVLAKKMRTQATSCRSCPNGVPCRSLYPPARPNAWHVQFSAGQPEPNLVNRGKVGTQMEIQRVLHAPADVFNLLEGRARRIQFSTRETNTQQHRVSSDDTCERCERFNLFASEIASSIRESAASSWFHSRRTSA